MSKPSPFGPKKPEKPPNHERWVISYADLLTLLLATFVSVGPLFFLVLQLSEAEQHPLHFLGLAYVYQFVALLLIR
ncbi:MAG: hypothetical protein B7X08_06160, partial [Acidocella sp. 20-63-7]